MRIEIRTSGGFTGKGTGNLVIEDATALRDLIDAALLTPAAPPPTLAVPDSIRYDMTVKHAGRRRTFTWRDGAAPPAAVLALFNAAWAMRE